MIYGNGTRLCRRSGAGSPSIRARHISVGARWGGVQKDTTGKCGGPPKKERKEKEKRVKNLSEGRGKCINDLVAAGLTGLHGHGWANGYYTATCAKKSLGYVTLSCGEVCWCAEVLRYASPKAAGVLDIVA